MDNPFERLTLKSSATIEMPFVPEHVCVLYPYMQRFSIHSASNPGKTDYLLAQANQFLDQKHFSRNSIHDITLIFSSHQKITAMTINKNSYGKKLYLSTARNSEPKLIYHKYRQNNVPPFCTDLNLPPLSAQSQDKTSSVYLTAKH
ncbi:hypothetical protein PT286_02310 [Neisseriaceae bacterium ESL0693]|nr:hypothetical protein [Neisseriaceae bacterium ESL0693]